MPHHGAKVLDFDVEELRDLFEVRLALESLAVRRAAERFTDADATAARAAPRRLDELRGEGDVRQTMRAHTDFHFTLYEASQSSWLVSLIRPAWDRSERFRPALLHGRERAAGAPPRAGRAPPGRVRGARPGRAAQALYEHLELASLFFETELAGEGIFARGA